MSRLAQVLAPLRAKLPGLILSLALGAAGGALFTWLKLPLAWMIGAMCLNTLAAMVRLPLSFSRRLRGTMIVVLGVMLGSAFTPDLLDRVAQWSITLTALLAYVAAATAGTWVFYRRVAGYDPVTSYFAATPGGLSEMIVLGMSNGGDDRAIALSHGARILLIVLLVPFGFQLLGGYQPGARPPAGDPIFAIPVQDLLILAGCALAGGVLAHWLKLPAGLLVGPMGLSALAHLTAVTASKPPAEVIAIAQVVVGSAIGARFTGMAPQRIARGLLLALGATAVLLAITGAFSLGLGAATELSLPGLFLGFAPGGVAEMSLIALALGADAAFVSTHHVARIFIVVVLAPLAFRLLRSGPPTTS